MGLYSGQRQVQTDIDKIRKDHTSRYKFVAERENRKYIVDVACGVGYGSKIMYDSGNIVHGVDIDQESITFAARHFPGPEYILSDLSQNVKFENFDVAVCFEAVEHLENPLPLLKALRTCKKLYVSVRNEESFPWKKEYTFHHRHYTVQEFKDLLTESGWKVIRLYHQENENSNVIPIDGVAGRTILAICERAENANIELQSEESLPVPESVAILGLGPSLEVYLDHVKRLGDRKAYTDEVWGINAVGGVIQCDRIFHMDDVRIQEIRAKAKPRGNIANMLKWLKTTDIPIYTSRPHDDYPSLRALPVEEMMNNLVYDYFNSTAAWAVAYAIHIGVKRIAVFGMDFTYENSHKAEKGRACVEFWLGVAAAKGIKIEIPLISSLMDSCDESRFYGFDTIKIDVKRSNEGIKCSFYEADYIPTAEEIEYRYDHKIHDLKGMRK
jgi:hypothetical protein